MTHDDSDSGWDFLAEDLGLKNDKAEPAPEAKEPAAERPMPRATISRPAPKPVLVEEEDTGDFGEGLLDSAPVAQGALFDPGPDAVAEDDDEFEGDADSLEDEGEDAAPGSEQDGGKKRRRRRRRKKKGPSAPDVANIAESEAEPAAVEEGEAPGEIESDDDDEEEAHSAMDEEMDAEAAGPRHEWHVMTWADLVSKLYRPN